MATALQTRWERVASGRKIHMIPFDDVIKHEPTVKCGCCPDIEKAPKGWVVFHQRVGG
jgi:hypothetical protein